MNLQDLVALLDLGGTLGFAAYVGWQLAAWRRESLTHMAAFTDAAKENGLQLAILVERSAK